MSQEPRQAPQVTVRDPARPGDVVVLQSAQRVLRPPVAARPLVACVLTLLTATALAVEVLDRRVVREDLRAAGVVALTVLPLTTAGGGTAGATGPAELVFGLRNDGPRAVTVLSGGLDGYGVVHEVEVRPDATAALRLARPGQCWTTTATSARGALAVSVRTATDIRRVKLDLPAALIGSLVTACRSAPGQGSG